MKTLDAFCHESVLQDPYTPLISENALVCLYGFRRADALGEHSADGDQPPDEFTVMLPPKVNLTGAKLSQVSLEGAVLAGADFSEANLSESIFRKADLTEANLSKANLTKSQLVNATLRSVNAQSAMMARANLEGADLADADMTGVYLSDAYLLQVRWEDSILRDVIWNGAVVPEEISKQIDKVAVELLKQRFSDSDPHTLDQYWRLIEQLRPFMFRIARLTSLMIHVDAEDLVHDAIVNLSAPPHLERLSKADVQGRYDYVYSMMRRMLLSQEVKAKRDITYAAEAEPEEEWADDVEFTEEEEEKEFTESENIPDEESGEVEVYSYPSALVSAEELAESDITDEVSDADFGTIEALANIEGYTIREIAEREEMSPAGVKNILDTARGVLRKHFADRAASD